MTAAQATETFGFNPDGLGQGWGIARRPDPQGQDGFQPGDLWVCTRGPDNDAALTDQPNFKTTRVAERSQAHGTWRYHFFAPLQQLTMGPPPH